MMTPCQPAFIQFEHVYKSFDDNPVLIDVSFEVCPGETLVILGRSGVGKSVTLMHIVGFHRPDRGRVFVEGKDLNLMTERELDRMREKVSLVFQSGALFDSLSIAENVTFAISERKRLGDEELRAEAMRYLKILGLEDVLDMMPKDLSTGMKRGVAIARALAAEPKAILYDEPTTGVDPIQAQLVAKLILCLKDQFRITSVVVTHDLKLTRRVADRVVLLVDGRVRFFGPRDEFFQSRDEFVQEFVLRDFVPALQPSA